MTLYLDDQDFKLYVGDVRDVLKGLGAGSVDCCVTSPPYWGQRDYGVDSQIGLEETPDEYISQMVEVFREVKRVLRDDGTLWLNIGDSYMGGGGGNYGTGFSNTHGQHLTNVRNRPAIIEASGAKAKDLMGIPWMLAFALRADGWYLRSEIVWSKPNAMPESILDRPTCAHEKVFLLAKQRKYLYDKYAVVEPAEWKRWGDQTNAKYNAEGSSKAGFIKNRSKKSIYEYINSPGDQQGTTKNLRNVWEIATQPYPGAHFATFPEALVEPCLKAGCPEQVCVTCDVARVRIIETDNPWKHEGQDTRGYPYEQKTGTPQSSESLHRNGGGVFSSAVMKGWTDCGHNNYRPGIVLDPFMGSGTTAYVARRLGLHAVGIELSPEYAKLCASRLQQQSLLA